MVVAGRDLCKRCKGNWNVVKGMQTKCQYEPMRSLRCPDLQWGGWGEEQRRINFDPVRHHGLNVLLQHVNYKGLNHKKNVNKRERMSVN